MDPDAEANGKILVHYNSAQDRAKKKNGFIYEPRLLDAKLSRLKRTSTPQSVPSALAVAQEKALVALSRPRDAIEARTGRFVVERGEDEEAQLTAACVNFTMAEKCERNSYGRQTNPSENVREMLSETRPYLAELAKEKLGGGVKFSGVSEAFATQSNAFPYVAWLDEVLEFTLVQGQRNLVVVARINAAVVEKWKVNFITKVADAEKGGFGKLTAVVFPDGRIAVGSHRILQQKAMGNVVGLAGPTRVLSAACAELVPKQGEACLPLAEQPVLAAFEISHDPQTGVITDIRDAYSAREAGGAQQAWVRDWSLPLDAALLAHGLALHNEIRKPFPENPVPLDCNAM